MTSAVLLAVLQGRTPGDCLKHTSKMSDAVKAGLLGNLCDPVIRIPQTALRLLDTDRIEVLDNGEAGGLLK